MKRKLGTKRERATYKKRKHTRPNRASAARGPTVEPVFGWIKAVLGFRQFSLRGVESVNAEWELICSATNLRRMAGRLRWAWRRLRDGAVRPGTPPAPAFKNSGRRARWKGGVR